MILDFRVVKKANVYRTATTAYPCFLPDLGDSTGAGRIRLPSAKLRLINLFKGKIQIKVLVKDCWN